jgi:hypothetical protein
MRRHSSLEAAERILAPPGMVDVLVSHDCPASIAGQLLPHPVAASLQHQLALAEIAE